MRRIRVADALPVHLALERQGGEALHWQLYTAFQAAILNGVFTPGTRLPSTRSLADDLGVSRTTVLQAFDRLVSEGYATARSGAGTRVSTTLPIEPVVRARLASDLHTSVAEQAVLGDFLAGGHFARHVRRTRELYHQRQQTLLELAPALTGGLLDVRPAAAGMQVLGLLPRGVDARIVARVAAERGVQVTPLSRSAPTAMTGGRGGLLLGYAAFNRDATRVALGTLGAVLAEVVAHRPRRSA